VAGPRGQQAGLGAVGPAQAEVDERLARAGQHHARGLGGDHGLEVQQVDQPALDQLRHRQRRGDPQDRLVGKEHRALGHGVDRTGEAQIGQIIQEILAEAPGADQPFELVRQRPQVLQELQRLREPGGHQEAAPGGQPAYEEFEHRLLGHAAVEISLHHVELVEVGQQEAGAISDRRAGPGPTLRTHELVLPHLRTGRTGAGESPAA